MILQRTVGWTDWNVLWIKTGGPNHVGNCFAPLHADTRTGGLIYTLPLCVIDIFLNSRQAKRI
jgi:glucosylceramidase